jgi:hypothetical protein
MATSKLHEALDAIRATLGEAEAADCHGNTAEALRCLLCAEDMVNALVWRATNPPGGKNENGTQRGTGRGAGGAATSAGAATSRM